MWKKSILLATFLISVFSFSIAGEIPTRPYPARWVNNLSDEMPGFLSSTEEAGLEKKLANFAAQTSNQIVIVIVDTLEGMEPWEYATQLGHEWGVGQEKFDNGIIILIKPNGEKGKRKLFLAVGYGLEGVIPDATTALIREQEMYPYFKTGEYFTALDKATDVLMALAKGEYNSDAYRKKSKGGWAIPFTIISILSFCIDHIWIFFILIFIITIIRKKRKGFTIGPDGTYNSSTWGSGGDSGWSSSSSDSFSSDFGGGDFGGGGSGGDW